MDWRPAARRGGWRGSEIFLEETRREHSAPANRRARRCPADHTHPAPLARGYPDARIDVRTGYPDVFRDNPWVTTVNPAEPPAYDVTVNLDLAYEREPRAHIVRAYMHAAFGDYGAGHDCRQVLFGAAPRSAFKDARLVVVHGAGATWRNRQQGHAFWLSVHALLREHGYITVSVGGPADAGGGGIDVRGGLPLHALYRLIARAGWFVGSDSGPLHVAGATDTPLIGLFSCAHPALRLPLRDVTPTIGLVPELDCVGCLHEEPPPVTSCGCRRGDYACVEGGLAIPARSISEKILAVDTGFLGGGRTSPS